MQRLQSDQGRTWILVEPSLTKPAESEKLIQSGAAGWWLYPSDEQDSAQNPAKQAAPSTCAAVIAAEEIDSTEYAIHWTRRRHGAWPDQSDPEYLDDLIFRRDSSDHHALSSLRRILMTQRLISSNALTRASTPVVCFADVRLTEIKERRTFRSHLSRWDFEPYGIAIRKNALERHGARAVIYGDERVWDGLADPDRPFFQLASDPDAKHDWRSEHEIRVCGDLGFKTNRAGRSGCIRPVSRRGAADCLNESLAGGRVGRLRQSGNQPNLESVKDRRIASVAPILKV